MQIKYASNGKMSVPSVSVPQDTQSVQKDAAAVDAGEQAQESKRRNVKSKVTFMLHDPEDMSSMGKYQSTDYRYAALKAASKGWEKILLRKTNSKEVREFSGTNLPLDTPKEINRGDRVITYTKKPAVKFLRKFTFAGDVEDEGQATEDPPSS